MTNKNKVKKTTSKKILIGIVSSATLILAIFVVLAFILVRSFIPTNDFEGVWEGELAIEEISNEYLDDYENFQDSPINVQLFMDEQSRTYGHIRLLVDDENFFIEDELYPSIYDVKIVSVDWEGLIFEATITEDGNEFILNGEFSKYDTDNNLIANGNITAKKVSSESVIFD